MKPHIAVITPSSLPVRFQIAFALNSKISNCRIRINVALSHHHFSLDNQEV